MINVSDFKFSIRSGFRNRAMVGVAIVFYFFGSLRHRPIRSAACGSQQTIAFPALPAGACLILKQFGIGCGLSSAFPRH